MDLDSSCYSDESFPSKKVPQFRGIFYHENKTRNKTNNHETKDAQGKERNINFSSTSNFFTKNTFNKKNTKKPRKKKKKKINLMSRV